MKADQSLDAEQAGLGASRTLQKTLEGRVPFSLALVDHDLDPGRLRVPAQPATDKDAETAWRKFQTTEHYQIYKHLLLMPKCVEVMKRQRGDEGDKKGPYKPLENVNVIAMHHIDDKAYGALSVLREWGATDMTAVFVGYNALMEKIYRPELDEIPDDKFRACIIQANNQGVLAEGTYEMVAKFNKYPANQPLPNDALNAAFANGHDGNKMTFLQAMQCLTIFNFLRDLARSRADGKKLMVFEDGGYLHPIINLACFDKLTVVELRKRYSVPEENETDARLPDDFGAALAGTFIGSTEYTRNGYDRSVYVQQQHKGRLKYPLFSIAVSDVKTRFEGDTISAACLSAVSSVLYSVGASVKLRTAMVIGSRGNIGRFFLGHISNLLLDPTKWMPDEKDRQVVNVKRGQRMLLGCDLKVGWPDSKSDSDHIPSWATKPDVPNDTCLAEAVRYKDFRPEHLRELDLIFGVTGGPTRLENGDVNHTVVGNDMEEWLVHGNRPDLFLASGSTKTSEFSEVLKWLNKQVSKKKGDQTILGRKVNSVIPGPIEDILADAAVHGMDPGLKGPIKRNFGTKFEFTLASESSSEDPVTKTIYLLNNTMPVNFMFYGTPAEILDYSYAQLLDVTAWLGRRVLKPDPNYPLAPCQVFATDYRKAATDGVWNGQKIKKDFPVPGPAGDPMGSEGDAGK